MKSMSAPICKYQIEGIVINTQRFTSTANIYSKNDAAELALCLTKYGPRNICHAFRAPLGQRFAAMHPDHLQMITVIVSAKVRDSNRELSAQT